MFGDVHEFHASGSHYLRRRSVEWLKIVISMNMSHVICSKMFEPLKIENRVVKVVVIW